MSKPINSMQALTMQIAALEYPHHLVQIPKDKWPDVSIVTNPPIEVWRSRGFLVQVFVDRCEDRDYERLSVLRTSVNAEGRFCDGITWDELMRIKRECGRGDAWAVEVYPPDASVVNVQNIRHLFLLDEAPPFAWNKP